MSWTKPIYARRYNPEQKAEETGEVTPKDILLHMENFHKDDILDALRASVLGLIEHAEKQITLSAEDSKKFLEALAVENPPEPNEALKKAAKKRKKE